MCCFVDWNVDQNPRSSDNSPFSIDNPDPTIVEQYKQWLETHFHSNVLRYAARFKPAPGQYDGLANKLAQAEYLNFGTLLPSSYTTNHAGGRTITSRDKKETLALLLNNGYNGKFDSYKQSLFSSHSSGGTSIRNLIDVLRSDRLKTMAEGRTFTTYLWTGPGSDDAKFMQDDTFKKNTVDNIYDLWLSVEKEIGIEKEQALSKAAIEKYAREHPNAVAIPSATGTAVVGNEYTPEQLQTQSAKENFIQVVGQHTGDHYDFYRNPIHRMQARMSYLSPQHRAISILMMEDPQYTNLQQQMVQQYGINSPLISTFNTILLDSSTAVGTAMRIAKEHPYYKAKSSPSFTGIVIQQSEIAYDFAFDMIHTNYAPLVFSRYNASKSLDKYAQPLEGEPPHPFIYFQQALGSQAIAIAELVAKYAIQLQDNALVSQGFDPKFPNANENALVTEKDITDYFDHIYEYYDNATQSWEAKVAIGSVGIYYTISDLISLSQAGLITDLVSGNYVKAATSIFEITVGQKLLPVRIAKDALKISASVLPSITYTMLKKLAQWLPLAAMSAFGLTVKAFKKIFSLSGQKDLLQKIFYYAVVYPTLTLAQLTSNALVELIEDTIIARMLRKLGLMKERPDLVAAEAQKLKDAKERALIELRSYQYWRQYKIAFRLGLGKQAESALALYNQTRKGITFQFPDVDQFAELIERELRIRSKKSHNDLNAQMVLSRNIGLIKSSINELTGRNSALDVLEQKLLKLSRGQLTAASNA